LLLSVEKNKEGDDIVAKKIRKINVESNDIAEKKPKKKKEKSKKKNISIDYFQSREKIYEDGELIANNLYGLKPIFELAQKTNVKERTWDYHDDIARLQIVRPIEEKIKHDNIVNCKDLWEIQFVRIRKDLLPGIANDEGEYDPELLSKYLKDNQGIAETISGIYDNKLCVLVLQRNVDGITPSGILDFLRKVSDNNNIALDVIDLDIDLSKIKKSNIFRKIEIGFSELNKERKIKTGIKQLNNILDAFNDFDTSTATLTMSMSNSKRGKTLSQNLSVDTVLELNKDPNVNKLRLRSSEEIDTNVEVIDLIEQRLKDKFVLEYSKTNPISHGNVILNILDSYNKHWSGLTKKLKIE
jgi:hypothetical protein